ncbi:hypothetical protein AMECASPLE_027507 [Ameca splendens]|uniref:Uncharacterized protein n=1 Tax=Ameca splendens TaxID=208324 RepID=A0ABV0YS92_9TELE
MQHIAGNTEGPQLPQEVQSGLSFHVDGFTVASLLQSVVQVNTEVFILLHHLHFSHDGNSVSIYSRLSENLQSYSFIHIQDEMIFPHLATKRSTSSLYSSSCPSLIHTMTPESSEYFCR